MSRWGPYPDRLLPADPHAELIGAAIEVDVSASATPSTQRRKRPPQLQWWHVAVDGTSIDYATSNQILKVGKE